MNALTRSRILAPLILVVVAAAVVLLDQLTKMWIKNSLPLGEGWHPIPGLWRLVRITHTTNSGAAFGIFPQQTWIFTVIAAVVVVVIVLYYQQLPSGGWLIRVSLGLLLGGSIGNLIDRIEYGYVVDFVDFGYPTIFVFNVADAAITIGVVLFAVSLWLGDRDIDESALPGVVDEAGP